MNYPSESGHWYDKNGNPIYTIVGKNGKERPTTLRDAKKEGYVPSVTEIIKCAHKPFLQSWIQDQVLMSALTLTRLENEPEETYIQRIKDDAQEQARKARERGTEIHAWVQSFFENKPIPVESHSFCESVYRTIKKECGLQEWVCEQSFSTERYGGKIDLNNSEYVIDIKTTEKDLTDIKTYDDHSMQLAAYDNCQNRQCGILYINYQADSKLIWVKPEDLVKGFKMFNGLLDYWYAKTGL